MLEVKENTDDYSSIVDSKVTDNLLNRSTINKIINNNIPTHKLKDYIQEDECRISFTNNTPSSDEEVLNNRRIKRRNREYDIPNNKTILQDVYQNMITDLHDDANMLSNSASSLAKIYRVINILITITITLAGTSIGILAIVGSNTMATAILGFYISTAKTVSVTFNLELRSATLKETSREARKIKRTVVSLRDEVDPKILMKKIESLYSELDDLEQKMFDISSTKQ